MVGVSVTASSGCAGTATCFVFVTIILMIIAISTNVWLSTSETTIGLLSNEGLWKRCFIDEGCLDWSDVQGTPNKITAVRAWSIIYLIPAVATIAAAMCLPGPGASVCSFIAMICAVLVVGIFAGYKIDNALFGIDATGFPIAPATPFGYDWGYWLAVSSLVLVGVAWLLYMFTACTGGDESKEEKRTDQGDEEAPPEAEDKGAKGKGEETVPPPMPAEVPPEGADTAPAA